MPFDISLGADNEAGRFPYLVIAHRSGLRSRVVLGDCLWRRFSIFCHLSLSKAGVAYSSRSTRFIMSGYYMPNLKLVKQNKNREDTRVLPIL